MMIKTSLELASWIEFRWSQFCWQQWKNDNQERTEHLRFLCICLDQGADFGHVNHSFYAACLIWCWWALKSTLNTRDRLSGPGKQARFCCGHSDDILIVSRATVVLASEDGWCVNFQLMLRMSLSTSLLTF